ncbi:MAG: hypothetical protein WCS31_02865 [Verrucomicrobiae bacterium]
MSRVVLESAEKELLRHLKLGKNVRSTNGTNRVRALVLAALANPAVQKLCQKYKVGTGELCTACTEILDAMPEPAESAGLGTAFLGDPVQMEKFLAEIHRAAHGQPRLRRHLAIVACAKRHAALLAAPSPAETRPEITRAHLLNSSIMGKLPLVLLCTAVVVAAILAAVYLL